LSGKRNGSSFFKSVYCLSGLGIVGKNRGVPKHFDSKKVAVPIRTLYLVSNSVLSLRSFNHEFTRF